MARRPPRRARSVGDMFSHARGRARTRFAFELTRTHYDALIQAIRAGRGVLLFRESNTRTHWLIRIGDEYGSAVYNSATGGVSTLLDQLQVEQNLMTFGQHLAQFPLARAIVLEDLCSCSSPVSSVASTPVASAVARPSPAELPAWVHFALH